MRGNVLSYWGFILVLVLSLWSIKPLLAPGFFPMHDDTQVVRVYEMAKSLKDGHVPVRWVKDLGYGYGYPLFNFYAPLPYYIGALINLSSFDALISTKAIMILGILLSGLTMYLLAREFWGELGGIVSGLFYVYAPYHALDLYVRGAVGEFWALVFIPIVFFGLWKVHKEHKWKWVVVGGVSFAGIITSHNLTALMVTPFILLAILLLGFIAYKNTKFLTIRYILYAISLGLGLASFYWVPALFEMGYTNVLSQIGGGADFRNHFVCLSQLWESPWGFGGSSTGCIDGMSFKIGKLHIVVALISFILGVRLWKKDRARSAVILFACYMLIVSILMMLDVSKTIWERNASLAFIQYPWRFLTVATFVTAFLTGSLVWFFRDFKYLIGFVLVVALLFFNLRLFQPQTILPLKVEDYISEEHIKWTTSKISDEYMPKYFKKPLSANQIVKERFEILKGEGVVSQTTDKTQELIFEVDAASDLTLLVKLAYFPSWRAFIDGKEANYKIRSDGLELSVPSGSHSLYLAFIETPIERVGSFLTIGSVVALFGILLRKRNEKTHS